MFNFIDFENDYSPVCSISVEEWNSMSLDQQEEYIRNNNIKVTYTHDISDTLSRGFGEMDQFGFWEYQCKKHIIERILNDGH